MTTNPELRIAVAGATGRIGASLVAQLATSCNVVALTRSAARAALPTPVSIAEIDFASPSSLDEALRGVDRLFVSHGTSLQQTRNEIALIDAAVRANVAHVVKISAMGPATTRHPFDWHVEIESHLARQPIGATVLRPGPFMDVLRRDAPDVAVSAWGGASGCGRVNFVDTRDVADVARVALLATVEPGSQRALHLTGSRSWSMPEIAAELESRLGRPLVYEHRTVARQHAHLAAAGFPDLSIEMRLGLEKAFRESALAEVTGTVTEVTGRAPRSLTAWLDENLAAFRGPI